MTNPVIVWFRRDLRLSDNPALTAAVQGGGPVICLYVLETDCDRAPGGASAWWLHQSLSVLRKDIENLGGQLILRRGEAAKILDDLIKTTGADGVLWNRRYAKDGRDRDSDIKADLSKRGIYVESFNANLLSEPWQVKTKTDNYYKVFTPYWRAAQSLINRGETLPTPSHITAYPQRLPSDDLDGWALLPADPDWAQKLAPLWQPGSLGARDALDDFLSGPVDDYAEARDRPDNDSGTSKMSPHLAFGEISPRQIWAACERAGKENPKFLAEIGWREFSYVLLFHNPDLGRDNFKSHFDEFPWEDNSGNLARWQRGLTGYPFVDAGMRQLWDTGWQHNRVRMVTASFLIKHLLLHWRHGEAWFHDTLVDYDPASNAASWQWVAGSGADASPYFRIFNPFTQGEKFDPNGDYVRRYVPELAHMPAKFIHRPWDAPADVLKQAGVRLGENYPKPIVDHKFARERALAAYKACRGG